MIRRVVFSPCESNSIRDETQALRQSRYETTGPGVPVVNAWLDNGLLLSYALLLSRS